MARTIVTNVWRELFCKALKRKVRTPVFQIADLLAIVAGAIAGAIAFLPFVFTLKPVLDDKQNADMLKGMVSLAFS